MKELYLCIDNGFYIVLANSIVVTICEIMTGVNQEYSLNEDSDGNNHDADMFI